VQRAFLVHVEDVAALRDVRTEHTEAGKVHVERTDADRISAGRRAGRAAQARQQRAHRQEARAQPHGHRRRHVPVLDAGAVDPHR
jgi:hypothetical protein